MSRAYEATSEDVANVIASNTRLDVSVLSLQALSEQLWAVLDHESIEEQALMGDDLDEQVDYVNDEIARQLVEREVISMATASQILSPQFK
jgi:hypothetical protein